MKKIILISIFFILLQNCGYTPLYSVNSNLKIYIENLDLKSNDDELSKFIKMNLKRYTSKGGIKLNIEGNINYIKRTIRKNSAGEDQEYELSVFATFTINPKSNKKYLEIKEYSNVKKLEDKFEEKQYEKMIKQNLAQSITSKLMMRFSTINDY